MTLVYLYHVNRCGHHKKLSIAKLDFAQVCGLSLNFYNNTLRKFRIQRQSGDLNKSNFAIGWLTNQQTILLASSAPKSVLSWSISISRILDNSCTDYSLSGPMCQWLEKIFSSGLSIRPFSRRPKPSLCVLQSWKTLKVRPLFSFFPILYRTTLILYRAIIQNGIALHGTWVTIATLINLGIVISYTGGAPQPTASTVSLSILTCEVILYFILENFVWERYLRYTFSVWPVVIWALSASINGNWDPEKTNSVFSAILLALACVFFIMKIVLSVVRCRRSPL